MACFFGWLQLIVATWKVPTGRPLAFGLIKLLTGPLLTGATDFVLVNSGTFKEFKYHICGTPSYIICKLIWSLLNACYVLFKWQ